MIEYAIIILIILLLFSPFTTLIFAIMGALLVSAYSNKTGGEFIDPSFDNVFNIRKKITTMDKIHFSYKHYIIVNRSSQAATREMVGHSINTFFGNAGQDHFVVVDMKLKTSADLLDTGYFVINKPVTEKHLLERIDSSYRSYIIPDDSIWYSHLNYYFLGQTYDAQDLLIDLDGLLMKNFAYDFEYGFTEINPTGIEDYMNERRTMQLSKINSSLLNSSKNIFDHFNLLFISRLKDLQTLGKEGGDTLNYEQKTLLENAQKLIDVFQAHPYWMNFNQVESQISKKADILKRDFPELSDVEIKRFVRYYFLIDKNDELLMKRLLIHTLAKSINMCNLFDEFMLSKFHVDIFPIFLRNDFYKACERLVSGIVFDLNMISKEGINALLGEIAKRLTMENIKNEMLKGNYVDAKTVGGVSVDNMEDIQEYCSTWNQEAYDNIKQLCSSEEMHDLERQKKEALEELSRRNQMNQEKGEKEYKERQEREYLEKLPNIIKESELEEVLEGVNLSDFVGIPYTEIKDTFLQSSLTDADEIEKRTEYIKHRLGWLEHYKKQLNELKTKYHN